MLNELARSARLRCRTVYRHTRCLAIFAIKSGGVKMFLLDIIAIGVISVATCLFPRRGVLVMRVLVALVSARIAYRHFLIAGFPAPASARSPSVLSPRCGTSARPAPAVGYWRSHDMEGGWRWMLGSAFIPCLII